ncbi:MAG TPA: shikimate dehydrogenase [Pirellulales bacterium]|nr:shikimate dehydrogenase [Pirellulales bacterium]
MPRSILQEVCALLGQAVAGNPTQYMMEKLFIHHGLDWRYLTLEVTPENLGDAIRGIRALGFRGANITKPHKVPVLEYLDRLTDAAALIGAVNCIVRDGEQLVGENTDGKGFLQSLRGVVDPAGKRIMLLGAGGAARAIAVELALAGAATISVVNRSIERGQSLVDRLNEKTHTPAALIPWEGDFRVTSDTDVLVNATSIGLNDESARVPVNLDAAPRHLVVADVIASPPVTRLVRKSQQAGFKTLDGVGMIVNQGAIGFKLWTGIDADVQVMRDAAEEFVES